jgi:hypothetical protein
MYKSTDISLGAVVSLFAKVLAMVGLVVVRMVEFLKIIMC